ncbi:hypothetical protein EKO27_g10302, partial [Xylaria grammica]
MAVGRWSSCGDDVAKPSAQDLVFLAERWISTSTSPAANQNVSIIHVVDLPRPHPSRPPPSQYVLHIRWAVTMFHRGRPALRRSPADEAMEPEWADETWTRERGLGVRRTRHQMELVPRRGGRKGIIIVLGIRDHSRHQLDRGIMGKVASLAALAASLALVAGQTYQRLGACPSLGCVLPPDQSDFLPGQYFDLRVEVHAPVNGSEAYNNGKPDENFSVTVTKQGGKTTGIAEFFRIREPKLEKWDFSWYEDLFAEDAGTPSVVNVAAKAYRRLAIYEPGTYVVELSYYGGKTTRAEWVVRPLATKKKAKNVILFIGDGMTTNMITAARLIGHKSINGKYQSLLQLDKFPVLGHQMTHSLDSYITDSANSASALYSGHKSTVNAMGVYADSSPDLFDDPKVETIVEILRRVWDSAWGAVSTAQIADATPIALSGHSRSRYQYGALVDQALNSVTNYTWTNQKGPDVWFGGGAEQFYPGKDSYQGEDYYAKFAAAGYHVSLNKTSLLELGNSSKALGVFCRSHLPVWLDRNVYMDNLADFTNDPRGAQEGKQGPALDLPGLKEMTLKAVDILHERGGDKGFFLMSEGASIDKQMHTLDYDRALGDLLELDDTVRATIAHLRALGELENTLVIVTADHGHGFDVFGGVDTTYLASQSS